MHINTFDHYQVGNSRFHQLDPRFKLVLTVLFILSNLLLPDGAWIGFAVSWFLLLFAARVSKISARFIVIRSFVAVPFMLAAFSVVFTIPGKPIVGFSVGEWGFMVTEPGLIRFISIVIRSWISVQSAIFMTAITPFPDLIHGMRHLRIPGVLVTIISFMYRYLFVLIDEAGRLIRAREARSAGLPDQPAGGSLIWRARVAGNMAGQLFIRSYDRSDRVYNAMLARGYRGTMLTLNPHVIHKNDWIIGFLVIFLLGMTQLIGRVF